MPVEAGSRTNRLSPMVALVVLLVGLMIGTMAFPRIFLQADIETVVIDIDAPVSCRKRGSILFGPKQRSSTPRTNFEYCGYLSTEHGSLFLPESSRFNYLSTSREELHSQLSAGCRYTVTVYGYGEVPHAQRGISNSGRREILAVEPIGLC